MADWTTSAAQHPASSSTACAPDAAEPIRQRFLRPAWVRSCERSELTRAEANPACPLRWRHLLPFQRVDRPARNRPPVTPPSSSQVGAPPCRAPAKVPRRTRPQSSRSLASCVLEERRCFISSSSSRVTDRLNHVDFLHKCFPKASECLPGVLYVPSECLPSVLQTPSQCLPSVCHVPSKCSSCVLHVPSLCPRFIRVSFNCFACALQLPSKWSPSILQICSKYPLSILRVLQNQRSPHQRVNPLRNDYEFVRKNHFGKSTKRPQRLAQTEVIAEVVQGFIGGELFERGPTR